MTWDEATRVPTRRRIAAKPMAEQLDLLARMCRSLLRHRRGSKTRRYYRGRHGSPKVLNLEELQQPTTCSSSKTSGVAEVRSQLARATAAMTARDHCVGAFRQNFRPELFVIVSK